VPKVKITRDVLVRCFRTQLAEAVGSNYYRPRYLRVMYGESSRAFLLVEGGPWSCDLRCWDGRLGSRRCVGRKRRFSNGRRTSVLVIVLQTEQHQMSNRVNHDVRGRLPDSLLTSEARVLMYEASIGSRVQQLQPGKFQQQQAFSIWLVGLAAPPLCQDPGPELNEASPPHPRLSDTHHSSLVPSSLIADATAMRSMSRSA
jgi:hypothetical protein